MKFKMKASRKTKRRKKTKMSISSMPSKGTSSSWHKPPPTSTRPMLTKEISVIKVHTKGISSMTITEWCRNKIRRTHQPKETDNLYRLNKIMSKRNLKMMSFKTLLVLKRWLTSLVKYLVAKALCNKLYRKDQPEGNSSTTCKTFSINNRKSPKISNKYKITWIKPNKLKNSRKTSISITQLSKKTMVIMSTSWSVVEVRGPKTTTSHLLSQTMAMLMQTNKATRQKLKPRE